MISFLAAVILAIGVISIYFVFVTPSEHSDSNEIDGNDNSIEIFKYFEDNFWRSKNMEPLHICLLFFTSEFDPSFNRTNKQRYFKSRNNIK